MLYHCHVFIFLQTYNVLNQYNTSHLPFTPISNIIIFLVGIETQNTEKATRGLYLFGKLFPIQNF